MVDHVRRHIGLGKLRAKERKPRWLRVLATAAGLLVLAAALYTVSPVLGLFVVIVMVNALLEQHKLFTQRAPVDIEVLSLGAAYLSAAHGLPWGLALGLLGPVVSHGTIAYFGDATVVKIAGHVVTAIVAAFVPLTGFGLFGAVLAGLAVQFLLFVFVLGRSALSNVLARLTTAALALYVLLLLGRWLPG